MYKNYLENKKRVKLITSKVKEMKFQDEYKPFVADILLRRAFEYDLSDEDIEKDLATLKKSLRNIIVEEPPKSDLKSGGIYYSEYARILINEKLLGTTNNIEILETLAHEVYHALCYTEEKENNDSLEWVNDITQEWNTSLLETIVECAAARTVFEKGLTEENPYYYNYTKGYVNTTFAVSMICAVYGIKEKDFLKNAILGEDRLLDFLAEAGNESREDSKMFLNKVDANLSLLHSVLYRDDDEPKLSKKEIDSRLRDGLEGLYYVCVERFEERAKTCEDKENLKFSFNKIQFIMDEALSKTSKLGLSRESSDNISKAVSQIKKDLFEKLCDLVDEKLDKENPVFPLTKEMKKNAELPESGEEEKKWNNENLAKKLRKTLDDSRLTVYRNGESLLDKVRDLKGYHKHRDYRNLSEFAISRMDIPKEYKSIFLDIILRRAYQFRQEPEELKKDLEKLCARLSQIDMTTQNSHYNPNKKSLKMSIFAFLDDSKALYENFTYQTYKFLADENFEENAKDDGLFRSMIQRAASRATFDKPKAKNPYFNNEKLRDDYILGVDLVAMTYGIPETELLKVAINGKDAVIDFLSDCAIEPREETLAFWEKLNKKLEKVRELEVISIKEQLLGTKEKDEEYIECMSDAINLCIEKSIGVFDRIRRV